MKQHANPLHRSSRTAQAAGFPRDADDSSFGFDTRPVVGKAVFESFLSSGGDERLEIDTRSGRSRYGIPSGLTQDEIWLSSSTASAVSPRGYAAARMALARTMGAGKPLPLPAWFDEIRRRLLDLFGCPGAEVALCASGTEAELHMLAAAQSLLARPLTNFIVAPLETGRGVILAADGRHFLDSAPFSGNVGKGKGMPGFDRADRQIETIELRDRYGVPLDADAVDALVVERVEALVAGGRDVLLHLLDCSKTGQSGPTRGAAQRLAAAYPENVLVVVDACQLRCSREQARADLEAGFAVMLTGSKFAGGPPFAGALLFPAAVAARLGDMVLPEGLAAYSAAFDWSPSLREKLSGDFGAFANIGLGLRWECALAELESYFALDSGLREQITWRFAREVESHLAEAPQLKQADPDFAPAEPRTIFPILTFDERGRVLDAEKLHRALRDPSARPGRRLTKFRRIHLGQPVPIGEMQALRVCLGAPQVNDVAARIAAGEDFESAFQPLARDLDEVFGLWTELAARDGF